MSNIRKDRVDQCKVVWYQWANEVRDDGSEYGQITPNLNLLGESRPYDISNHVIDVVFSKGLGQGAGSFTMTLSDSLDWKRFMKSGEWAVLMLTPDGDLPLPQEPPPTSGESKLGVPSVVQSPGAASDPNSFLVGNALKGNPIPSLPTGPSTDTFKKYRPRVRALLYIQRVAIKGTIIDAATGAKEITYTVTGKDFGVCMEETELWFNFFQMSSSDFGILVSSKYKQAGRNLQALMDLWFNVFLRPDSLFPNDPLQAEKALAALKQWLLPKTMLDNLGMEFEGNSFFGNIKGLREFHETLFENNIEDPLSGTEGFCWNKLKELSQPEFHEFFTETTEEGKPRIYFRPIPWSISQEKYPNISKNVLKYSDLAKDSTPTLDFVGTTIGGLGDLTNSTATGGLLPKDQFRQIHRINLGAVDILDYDIGPDIHAKYNQFLIDSSVNSALQNNAIVLFQKNQKVAKPFPFRNENSIKRHGFRPMNMNIKAYLTNTDNIQFGPFKTEPNVQFLLETNEVMKDYWGQAGFFESGSFALNGLQEVKLGKVFVTEDTADLPGISNMIFYIEAYTDHFSVGQNGVGIWNQSVLVSRGIELKDLETNSDFNQKEALYATSDFHVDPKGST